MEPEHKHAETVAIIGGADGPTSVLIAGKNRKLPLRVRVQKCIYKYRRRKAAKRIVAGGRTLEELVAYAVSTYGAVPAEKVPEEQPASRMYVISVGNNRLDLEIDDTRETFSVSYSGNKKAMKQFHSMVKDLYLYYGVSEADICQKTERYYILLSVLSVPR